VVEVVSRPDALVRSVPELWDLYQEYQRIGGTADELLQVTASLVVSGYYVDPTVHDEFGDSTAEQLQQRTGFALAARLTPWLGSYPALFVGIAWGLLQYVRSARTLRLDRFGTMILSFVGVCASRSAVGYLRLEQHAHDLLLRLLTPAKGLHRHNALRLVYDLIAIAVAEKKGAFGDAHDGYLDQLARLPHVKFFEEEARHHYEAGLLCSLGRCHLLCMGAEALACADRVDAMGSQHDRILAQYLRSSYHLYRGETAKAEAANEVLDTMAARYGYRWIPDILAVLDFVPYQLSGDVVGLKRVLYWSERLLTVAPAYAIYRDVIRAMYEGHRGRPEIALELYEPLRSKLEPFSHPAWSFAHAHRAECLNALGRHQEALTVCQEALRHVGEVSRVYVVAYQQLERESAIALAGLGHAGEAAQLLDDLLTRHERDSQPLIIGLLHRDRARVAKIAGDPQALERHARAACEQFSLTENPTLLGQARRLAELTPTFEAARFQSWGADVPESFGLLDSVAGVPLKELAQRALELIVEVCGASSGRLYGLQNKKPILLAGSGHIGDASRVESQVEQLLATFVDGETTDISTLLQTPDEESVLTLLPLVLDHEARREPVGVAALFGCRAPDRRTEHLLREVALALRSGAITVMDRKPQSQ
jgi:tetratricopeptide (TPR) repeat protein